MTKHRLPAEPPSKPDPLQLVRARVVVPIARQPIDNGAVLLSDGRIQAVAPLPEVARQAACSKVVDLGEAILLPGLVNSHCHLDYTGMAGLLSSSGTFVDWIKRITTLKAQWSLADFERSWLNGAKMLLRTGTTTVADVEAVPRLLPFLWQTTPLRVFSFIEMTGVASRRQPELILSEAVAKIESLPPHHGRAGLAPHAPYSTTPTLIKLSGKTARRQGWRLTIHVAESEEEFDMFEHRRGAMFEWLARNHRDMSDCGGVSPVRHLHQNGVLGRHLLAVHANYLAQDDMDLLRRKGVNVVHCPRSHAYFQHRTFPLGEFRKAGLNLCLGTDSLATVPARGHTPTLSMFAEMNCLSAQCPELSPGEILRMATINGARALGLDGAVGQLVPGADADMIALRYDGNPKCAVEATVNYAGDVMASMIQGAWFIGP